MLPNLPPMPQVPCSPRVKTGNLIYFARLCDKVRLNQQGHLPDDYIANLGKGMDLWCCQFLGVDYEALKQQILSGADDETALKWAEENGQTRDENETAWWTAYMETRGFRDDMSDRLEMRKSQDSFSDRTEMQTFFDYIDADEGH